MKDKYAGKEICTLLEKKSVFFDDLSSILKYGTTSPSVMFEPRPKFLIFIILLCIGSGIVVFSWTQHIIPVLLFLISIALIVASIWAIINSNKWSSLEFNFRKEAESELDKSDREFQGLKADKEHLEEALRNMRDIEHVEFRRERSVEQAVETEGPLICINCKKKHTPLPSIVRHWHQCEQCGRIYCDECGSALPRDFSLGGVFLRKCKCGGRTKLVG